MSPATVCVTPSPVRTLVVMFLIAWPFIALGMLRRRDRSAAPLTAMLIPVAVSLIGTWLGYVRVLEGQSIIGGGSHAFAAGVAEALFMIVFGAFSAAFVALAALIRRHRPVADRVSTALAVLAFAGVGLAHRPPSGIPFSIAAGSVTACVVIALFAWQFLVMRKRVNPQPLPCGAPVVILALAVMAVLTWERVDFFQLMARVG